MENKRVFIGNLDFSATEAELQSLVSRYGSIVSIKVNQKKGFAFIEMESAEDAGNVVQGLDGIKHRKREMRLSLEMKASKARSVSARKYKERGETLARQRSENFHSTEEQRPQDRPLSPGRTTRDGNRTVSARGPKSESGYKPRERSTTSETRPPRPYSRERTGSVVPAKRPWTKDTPSFSARPVRDGQRTGSSRPLKKEWSSQGPARPSVKTGENRAERPDRKSPLGPKSRDYSKPRSANGPQNRFSKSSRPGAAVGGSAYGPSKPTPGGKYAGRGKPPRRD